MLNQIFASSLERAMQKYLQHDESSLAKLEKLKGKVIGIEITGIGITVFLHPDEHGIRIDTGHKGEPDALIRGNPVALAALMTSEKNSQVMFTQHASITGDTVVGQQFSNILKAVDFDWEEELARITGDPLAHQLGRAVRHVARWGRDVGNTIEQDISEYLHEELRLVPTRSEIEEFMNKVDSLRNDTDRLELRVQRLLNSAGASS